MAEMNTDIGQFARLAVLMERLANLVEPVPGMTEADINHWFTAKADIMNAVHHLRQITGVGNDRG